MRNKNICESGRDKPTRTKNLDGRCTVVVCIFIVLGTGVVDHQSTFSCMYDGCVCVCFPGDPSSLIDLFDSLVVEWLDGAFEIR